MVPDRNWFQTRLHSITDLIQHHSELHTEKTGKARESWKRGSDMHDAKYADDTYQMAECLLRAMELTDVKVNEEEIETVSEFIYFGNHINKTGGIEEELKRRKTLAGGIF
ncbi:hypothetical protein HELRODRAFT_181992 [Helobdella robusta]|uniref:Uncharacterized protein n=1 Tax=Helobdella robusta TaxID=6412 RepID=T1FHK8_HELRO|nr:hypothetical protein HELRODRAFT_181992 [Helobdella robusta]ESN91933.1 hypothetical protein HELRODRAFT_181992 [Helobdella robusta]